MFRLLWLLTISTVMVESMQLEDLFCHSFEPITEVSTHSPIKDIEKVFKSYITTTGTTIVGVCCKDGVVLGADTRSTGGPVVMDKNKLKIHFIAPRIYCCAAGTSADCDQITRKAGHFLSLQRIERDLSGMTNTLDPIAAALKSITNSLLKPSGRKPQSSLILGGVDVHGPALYQIGTDSVPQRIGYGALGSGSTDAIAVLETVRSKYWLRGDAKDSSVSNYDSCYENVDIDGAIDAVRQAVRAGIMNDLGSGSHVDICVIQREGVRSWREKMKSAWDQEKLEKSRQINDGELCGNDLQKDKAGCTSLAGKLVYSRDKLRVGEKAAFQRMVDVELL